MELAFLLAGSVTFIHLAGALIRYEPFHDVLSRRKKKELFWSYAVIAVLMFPVYVLFFQDPDTQVPYLKTILGFLGITDIRLIYAEGLNMGPEAAAQGFAQADADLDAAFA